MAGRRNATRADRGSLRQGVHRTHSVRYVPYPEADRHCWLSSTAVPSPHSLKLVIQLPSSTRGDLPTRVRFESRRVTGSRGTNSLNLKKPGETDAE